MHVAKVYNWATKLNETIAAASAIPFAYGTHDCALFAANCVQSMTGTDLAADVRGRYQSKPGAKLLMREKYGGDLEQCMEQIALQYSLVEGSPMGTKRGDIVLCDTAEGPALGIVSGHYCCFAGPKGLTMITVRECRRAWILD